MSDQTVILPKWLNHRGIILTKGQLDHLYRFLTKPKYQPNRKFWYSPSMHTSIEICPGWDHIFAWQAWIATQFGFDKGQPGLGFVWVVEGLSIFLIERVPFIHDLETCFYLPRRYCNSTNLVFEWFLLFMNSSNVFVQVTFS